MSTSSAAAGPLPAKLGRYEVRELIGRGANGTVYRAHDPRLERDVAIKVLHPFVLADPAARKRFQNEALAVAKIEHPCIAVVHDFETCDGNDLLVTEYVPGMTLRQKLTSGTLPSAAVFEIGTQLADGLAAAHERNVVHCDIKLSNLRITPGGTLKIVDFGLATATAHRGATATDDADATVGMPAGTPQYMSPEQMLGEVPDARSDIYSAGCVLYELATGAPPFTSSTFAGLADAVLHAPVVPAQVRNLHVPAALSAIIARCLEKQRDLRYQTARDLLADLRRGMTVSAEGPRIAVLYFDNLNQSKEDEYFRDGVTEDITTELAKIRSIQVLSRSAVLGFRDKLVAPYCVGQQLNAKYVVEGSIRRSGERLRITARLVETSSGLAIWGARYDRELQDIFAVQDEIAQSIACALKVAISDVERRAIEKLPTSDVRAYDFYLRGRHFFHQFRRRGLDLAREMFTRAIEADPNYARAYAGIADCSAFLYMFWDSTPSNLEQANIASRKALELDPELAEAHTSSGLSASLKKEFGDAQRSFDAAIRLDPNVFEPYYFSGRNAYSEGRLEDAVRWFDAAGHVCPEHYQAHMLKASALRGLGREEEAHQSYAAGLAAITRHLDLYPDDARAVYFGANALTQMGDKERAMKWAAHARELEPDEPMVLYNLACVYSLLNELDMAMDCLERSVTQGWAQRQWMEHDPDLSAVRGTRRYEALIAATGTHDA